ncbi:hypothetical protein M5K25_000684 [Dendrobium thyrsiflorum]|uniref:Uncharacterized protein n=1 Tax=Dendrobium thyrsiflorum TaxID=117978 RepID=A0ABD0VW79_DENTH
MERTFLCFLFLLSCFLSFMYWRSSNTSSASSMASRSCHNQSLRDEFFSVIEASVDDLRHNWTNKQLRHCSDDQSRAEQPNSKKKQRLEEIKIR